MLNIKPLHPIAAVASPADKKRFRSATPSQHPSHHDDDDQFVYLKTTWVISSLRHPVWRLVACSLRLVCCFVVCVTSTLVNAHHTPPSFPVYGELIGVLGTNVTTAKIIFHSILSVILLALIRLVLYPLWFEDRWNWLRQCRIARQTFTRLSRSSSATQLVRNVATNNSLDEGERTITLHVYDARTNEAPSTRVRVHTAPCAQGSWTLMILLFPVLWRAVTAVLCSIVHGTRYEDMFFGKSELVNEMPQWRMQLIVYNVLMTLNVLSWLLTLDSVLQDARHCREVWPGPRRWYSSSRIIRIIFCWVGLAGIIVGGLYFQFFTLVRTWCLENWSTQASHSPDTVETFTSESWRCVLSSLVVVLDLLWLVQDWHFPGFASSVGTKIYGFHRDFLTIPLLRGKKLYLTSKWTSCFVVLGLLLPLDLCAFYQDYTYNPPRYSQVIGITDGYRLFPSTNTTSNEPAVIVQLSKEGSIGRFFLQSRLDKVPAMICVGMMVALYAWLQGREQWRLCYAAFLGLPSPLAQAQMKAKINAAAPKSTRESLKEQLHLHNLYRVRGQYDLLGSCLALVSIWTVILQARSIWRATNGVPDVQDTAGETYGVLLLVVSASMVYQLYHRYALKYEILVLRKQIPPSTYQSWWRGTPRSLLLLPFILEIVLSGLCLPPFLHGKVGLDEERYFVPASTVVSTIKCPPRMILGAVYEDDYVSCNLEYSYPVEVLNLIVIVRLYWLVRLLRNELFRRMFSDHAALLVTAGIGGNIPNEISSLRWSFKMCLALIPGRVIFSIFLILWLGTAASVSILERPFPSLLDNEEHSLWLTIVTISAVGYGDAYPITAFGRLSIIVGAVIGGAIVVSLMTSIFLDTLKGSKDEHKFVQELERITWNRNLQHLSATLIMTAWKAHRKGTTDTPTVFKLAHDFKAARKLHRPKETFESLDQLRISSIAKWRTKQLSDWTAQTTTQRHQLINEIEQEIAILEAAMQPLLRA